MDLINTEIYKSLSEEHRERLVKYTNEIICNEHQFVMRDGEASNEFYIILEGVVDIIKKGQLLVQRLEGDIIGEQGVIDNEPRSANGICSRYARLIKVNKDIFDDTQIASEIYKYFNKVLSKKLRQATNDRSVIYKRERALRFRLQQRESDLSFNEVLKQINQQLPLEDLKIEPIEAKPINGLIIVSDIRGFTKISEQWEISELQDFLNKYFEKMAAVIKSFNGQIDKYLGDGILMFFPEEKDVYNKAYRCILEMQAKVNELEKEISVGFGAYYGNFLYGDFGSKDKLEPTIIGDTVNTASRLQDLTKEYETSIIISDNIYNNLDNEANSQFEHVGFKKLRNKEHEINIYKYKK